MNPALFASIFFPDRGPAQVLNHQLLGEYFFLALIATMIHALNGPI